MSRAESMGAAALFAFVAACAPRSLPVEAARPAPAIASAAVDVDRDVCGTVTEGTVFTLGGSLWFDSRPPECGGPDHFGGFAPQECADDAWEGYDLQPQRTWRAGVTLVASVPNAYGRLIPGWSEWEGVAVRFASPDPETATPARASDALVVFRSPGLDEAVLWQPGGELHLMGRAAGRVVALVGGEGGARVAALGRAAGDVVLSEPFEGPEAIAHRSGYDASLPWAAPRGPDGFVILCGSRLCLARVGSGGIAIERVDLAGIALGVDDAGLVLQRSETACVRLGAAEPATWPALPEAPCAEELRWPGDSGGLPVDGAPAAGQRMRVETCLVRSEVELPPLAEPGPPSEDPNDDEHRASGAGLVELPGAPFYDQAGLALDLLVRGRTLAVGFRFLDGMDRSTDRRDFGVALGPGSVDARPVTVEGRPMYRVRLSTPVPFDTGSDCWLGRLVVRATDAPPSADWPDGQAFMNRYWEFGVCE